MPSAMVSLKIESACSWLGTVEAGKGLNTQPYRSLSQPETPSESLLNRYRAERVFLLPQWTNTSLGTKQSRNASGLETCTSTNRVEPSPAETFTEPPATCLGFA